MLGTDDHGLSKWKPNYLGVHCFSAPFFCFADKPKLAVEEAVADPAGEDVEAEAGVVKDFYGSLGSAV